MSYKVVSMKDLVQWWRKSDYIGTIDRSQCRWKRTRHSRTEVAITNKAKPSREWADKMFHKQKQKMKDTAMKHLKDSSKHAAPSPSASTKSCWKTIKLPLASTLRPDDENNIVDIWMEILFWNLKIEVDLIDPNTNKIRLRISRITCFHVLEWNVYSHSAYRF